MSASLRVVALLLVAAACQPREAPSGPSPGPSVGLPSAGAASGSRLPGAEPGPSRVHTLQAAELTRQVAVFQDADGIQHDVAVRRAAARGLARLRSPGELGKMLAALSDDDAEVVAWAASGLGEVCAVARDATVSALVARGLGLHVRDASETTLRPLAAIARAIGRCGAEASEKVLLDWVARRGPSAADALYALGGMAQERGHLREETCVVLLDLAAGSATAKPWALALQPLGRASHLPLSVAERAREVATARLVDGGAERVHAVRVLGRTDEKAVPALLAELIAVGKATPSERAEAAYALARLAGAGQQALREAVTKLMPETHDPLKALQLVGADFGPLLAALQALTDRDGARSVLDRYAKLEVAPEAPASVVRRTSQLRCAAARLLAESDFEYPLLTHCDRTVPKGEEGGGSYGARAMVAAIGFEGSRLVGPRRRAWQHYAEGTEVLARAAAIQWVGEHPELTEAERPLTLALESKIPGVIAAAAEVIAKHPDRLRGVAVVERRRKQRPKASTAGTIAPEVGKALISLLEGLDASADIEATVHVIEAAGAIALDGARESLGRLCRTAHPLLRQQAERALSSILGGDQKAMCKAPDAGLPLPEEFSRVIAVPTRLVFESDVGDLFLDLEPAFAPVAVTRLVELVKSGFYNGMVVHRVVPGFVTQLGSPTADGFGGAPGRAPLACETSPLGFRAGSVGMALAGRDTGSSQFFVTHADCPHLDGQYAWLGQSSGPWAALVEGDRIVTARVLP